MTEEKKKTDKLSKREREQKIISAYHNFIKNNGRVPSVESMEDEEKEIASDYEKLNIASKKKVGIDINNESKEDFDKNCAMWVVGSALLPREWSEMQIKKYKRGTLTKIRIDELKKVGFDFEDENKLLKEERWNINFGLWITGQGEKSTFKWAKEQREAYRSGKLSEARKFKLSERNFPFESNKGRANSIKKDKGL